MVTDVKTYDPAEVLVVVGGFIISGFAPGTLIELAPDAAPFRDDFGVDGEPARWASRNPLDSLTLSLAQSSASNFVLSNLLNADLVTHAGILPVLIMDNNTSGLRSTYVAARGWVTGPPRIQYAADPTARRWIIRLLNTLYNTKGIDGASAISI